MHVYYVEILCMLAVTRLCSMLLLARELKMLIPAFVSPRLKFALL